MTARSVHSDLNPLPTQLFGRKLPRLGLRFRYLWALALVALATGVGIPFRGHIAPTNLAMPFLAAVVVCAAYLGRGPAILVSLLSVLVFDFFFVPPFHTLRVSDTEYLITFSGLLVVGMIISELTARAREGAESARRREQDTNALYALSRDLAVAEGVEPALKAVIRHIHKTFEREAALFLPGPDGKLALRAFTQSEEAQPEKERRLSPAWSLEPAQAAGMIQMPLRTSQEMVGILVTRASDAQDELSPERQRLLEAFANQAALAIERVRLAERANQVQVMQETERLQTALINSISHDLRTPLVSITGSLSTLKEDGVALDAELRNSLVENAYQEAGRLNRLVSNLLNMTRLEAGAMKVVKQPEDVQDAIGSALEQLNERLGSRPVAIQVAPETPLVPMDFVLIVQVLTNVIDNALKYSPEGSPIDIQARISGDTLHIQVADRGIGIPPGDLERVFDKFYRVQRPGNVSGTGLGLSICKGIAEAHGGSIWAENRPGGGTVVTVTLPVKDYHE